MSQTRSIGIRLPNNLWDYVKSIDPSLTYSEIVKRALEEIYLSEEEIEELIPTACIKDKIKVIEYVKDIHNIIDSWECAF